MKKLLVLLAILIPALTLRAQTTEAEKQLKTQSADTTLGWEKGGMVNISTAQTSLTNWAAGGQSSVAINGLINLFASNKTTKSLWENYLDLGYGTLKQGKQSWWKTDDKIEFTSKYGYKTSEKLYIAGLVNFRTQFADGFNYPNDSVKISGLMAPGYFLAGVGIDYKPGDNFSLFVAPLTAKMTIVADQALADAGAFGVDPGDNVYGEFGAYLRMFMKYNVMENITFQSKLDLFSNYLHNPQNMDVNWECLLSMKVNKFISATLGTQLIYDDDIAIAIDNNDDGITDESGPRVQFKEILAVGFSYKF